MILGSQNWQDTISNRDEKCASESVYSSSNSNFRAHKNDTSFCNLVSNWMRVESKPFELWRNCGKTAFFIKRRNLAECTIEKVFSKELRYIIYYSISGPKKNLGTYLKSCHLVKYDTKVVLLCSYISNFTFWSVAFRWIRQF